MNTIKPITAEEFTLRAKTDLPLEKIDYAAYFTPHIEEAINFAIGPYFWFIGNNATMTITHASDNINELTPFTKQEWEGNDAQFLADNIHPEDRHYVLAALQFSITVVMNTSTDRQHLIRTSIYGRMLNANKQYRWTLIQCPKMYIEKNGNVTCGLMLVTDLTHFKFASKPVLLTITDRVDDKNYFYHVAGDDIRLLPNKVAKITKRELEILQLMTKGLNTPQIAENLCISYHTVENHKRNLREKTNCKTSSELIHYVMLNNLL